MKKFLWVSRLWVGWRKEPILGYVPKNYEKGLKEETPSPPRVEYHLIQVLTQAAVFGLQGSHLLDQILLVSKLRPKTLLKFFCFD